MKSNNENDNDNDNGFSSNGQLLTMAMASNIQ
jgi:hypothetical protein